MDANTPFDESMFSWIDNRYEWDDEPNTNELIAAVRDFKPDALLILGWHVRSYREVSRTLKGIVPRILYFDNSWRGTAKQWLGVLVAPVHVLPFADYAWVPGDRQRDFARRLGFKGLQIIEGSLSGDLELFSPVYKRKTQAQIPSKAFLFVGRMVEDKGVKVLSRAYAKYRSRCSDPWRLICAGAGPLAAGLKSAEGVTLKGFLQPRELAEVMLEASVFVLPSLFEPWGVVVNEAAAAGMPIIVSDSVGAHVHLVQSGYNGFVVGPGSSDALADAMLRMHHMPRKSFAIWDVPAQRSQLNIRRTAGRLP